MKERKRNYSPQYLYRYLRKTVIGQDEYLRKLAMTFWLHERRVEASETNFGDARLPKQNLLVVGPTGSGKTLAAQTLAKLYDRPLIIEDLSLYTGSGWKGKDTSELIQNLYDEAGRDKKKTESGIIILDEIDKAILLKDHSESSFSVEHSLLKILEGTVFDMDKGDAGRIDTSNILFIAAGAFEGIEEITKSRIAKPKSIGFLGNVDEKTETEDIYRDITKEDLRKYGCGAQLLGRFSEIAYLNKLGEEDLGNILRESTASPVKGLSEMLNMTCGVRVSIDEAGIKTAAKKAVLQGTGARGLSQIIMPEVNKVLFSLPDEVNQIVVSGKGEDLFIKEIKGEREKPFAGFEEETVYAFPNPKRTNVEHFAWNLLKEYLTKYTLPFNHIQAIHNLLCSIVYFILETCPASDRNISSLLKLANYSIPKERSESSVFEYLMSREMAPNTKRYYAAYKKMDPDYKMAPTLRKAIEWLDKSPIKILEAN